MQQCEEEIHKKSTIPLLYDTVTIGEMCTFLGIPSGWLFNYQKNKLFQGEFNNHN